MYTLRQNISYSGHVVMVCYDSPTTITDLSVVFPVSWTGDWARQYKSITTNVKLARCVIEKYQTGKLK